MRSEAEVAAATIALLRHHGVIADRYTAHQLAIYTGAPRDAQTEAEQQLRELGPDALKVEDSPGAPSEPSIERALGRGGSGPTPEEHRRDQYVRIRKAKPLRMLAAYYTARAGDDVVDEECTACGHPIRPGEKVVIVGPVYHEECHAD